MISYNSPMAYRFRCGSQSEGVLVQTRSLVLTRSLFRSCYCLRTAFLNRFLVNRKDINPVVDDSSDSPAE